MVEPPLTRLSLIAAMQHPEERGPTSLNRAWSDFIALYQAPVLSWAGSCGLQVADAQEIAQRLLMRLYDKLRTYREDRGHFRDWLRTVVKNLSRDYLREQQKLPKPLADARLASLADPEGLKPLEESIEAVNDETERVRAARERVMASVQRQTWEAFERCKVNGEATDVVAADLGLSVGAVRVACHRVGRRLREALGN